MIQITLNEKIFLKDPLETELGKRIIFSGISLIDEVGFEAFTFKKLGARIQSTEASIYRYFTNKHQLLSYLISWYWSWMFYQLQFHTNNIEDPKKRFGIALRLFTEPIQLDESFKHVDEQALHRIVVNESSKSYLRKEVDADNKEGYYASYKRLVKSVANIVREMNPNYPYPESLISTAIESAHHQAFFAEHLPSLTNINKPENSLEEFIFELVLKVID